MERDGAPLMAELVFVCFFRPCHAACGILVPQPGIQGLNLALASESTES